MKSVLISLSLSIFTVAYFCNSVAIAGTWTEGFIGLSAPSEGAMDIREFASAHVAITQAISRAQDTTGGTVLEIGFAFHGRIQCYSAIVVVNQNLWHTQVDAATGVVTVNHKRDDKLSDLTYGALRDLTTAQSAKFTLAQAAERVEKAIGGNVISIGIEELGGVPQYYVQSVLGVHAYGTFVDPHSGRLSTPQSIG